MTQTNIREWPWGVRLLSIVVMSIGVFLYNFGFFAGAFHRSYRVLSADDAQRVALEAIAHSNVTTCDHIKLSWWASIVGLGPDEITLKDSCLFAYAKAKRDASLCSRMLTSAGYCYATLAPLVDDPTLCTFIKYAPTDAGICMLNFAVTRSDATLCDRLPDAHAVDVCHQLEIKTQIKNPK